MKVFILAMAIMFIFSFAPVCMADGIVAGEVKIDEINPGGGTTTTSNRAPPAPVLTAPASNANLTNTNITFSWQAVTDPDGDQLTYRLYVNTSTRFDEPLEVTAATQFTRTLPNNTHFYWLVEVRDSYNSSFSDMREFTIGTLGGQTDEPQPNLTVPVQLSPANQATVNQSPVLSWQAVTNATGYTLMLWRAGYATSLTKNLTTISYNTTPDNLTEGTYLWKVKAFSLTQESAYSSERSFTLNLTANTTTNETNATDTHYCGDNVCNTDESCSSCAADCGACPVITETTSSGGGGGGGGGST
ncbi:MAG: hypothetical protein ABIH90_01070, partial [Candidatus Aenigmatarchaeota archaeon]